MSLLAPLYFLGGLAIGLPVLFHLIRRQPRGEIQFSSLMFLRPTPPRLTRRSRLENLPLLLIRALILGLLAAAFARPLIRSNELADRPRLLRSSVLLIDTSASMRRAGIWQRAMEQAKMKIEELEPGDQLALVRFDWRPEILVRFEATEQADVGQLQSLAKRKLDELQPSWFETDLGAAIRFAAEMASSRADTEETVDTSVVVISDLQSASHVESLQAYAWPDDVSLDLRPIVPDDRSNATIAVLSDQAAAVDDDHPIRVRVINSSDSELANFRVGWNSLTNESQSLPVQVPPGQSRVVRMPRPPSPEIDSLVLRGDDHDFDNRRYYISPRAEQRTLLHIGADADNVRDSLLYYLQQAPLSDRYRQLTIESIPPLAELPDLETANTPLIVIEAGLPESAVDRVKKYLNDGGRVLFVLANTKTSGDVIRTCNAITGETISILESPDPPNDSQYALLASIDFDHPLFAPMSTPPFNDFSKIRFWSHRHIVGWSGRWTQLARFDDGNAALIETSVGNGNAWLLTSGWQPSQSQLALSSKFVPLMFQFVATQSNEDHPHNARIGGPVPIQPSKTIVIEHPNGTEFGYQQSADLAAFDTPGIYRWSDQQQNGQVAVNLSLAESQTDTISNDVLEQFGVKLATTVSPKVIRQQQRQLRDAELESRQRIWQWLLAAALGLMGLEIWMAKRSGDRINEPSVT